jgi:predicted DCC family thiol-disulfide oxidoreductase YuxK
MAVKMKPLNETLFYDGHCGLCHGAVKFVLRHDREAVFRFAPLQGSAFEAMAQDTMVVQTADGQVLLKSDAWIHILRRIGWRATAAACAVFPKAVRDWMYDRVAAVRFRIWGRREGLCPIIPPELRDRFLL